MGVRRATRRAATCRSLCLLALAAGALVALPAGAAADDWGGDDSPTPLPGPAILHTPPAPAPQLTNTGVWHAAPILISGATAYRDGEFLYQDFLYDDHGAKEPVGDPNDPRRANAASSQPGGAYTYPLDAPTGPPRYANNAADLVELRVKPLADSTALRVTLNTLADPSVPAFSVALGSPSSLLHRFPFGANVSAPADDFLTVHPSAGGMVADLQDATTGEEIPGMPPTVSVDLQRNQVEVRVSHAQWNPGSGVARLAAGVGLWDNTSGAYLLPQLSADTAHPGGSGGTSNPAAFFNVAFRTDEDSPHPDDLQASASSPAWWRDQQQAQALAAGDISRFTADVDFAKLQAGIDDESQVHDTGLVDRIFASRYDAGTGVNLDAPLCNACPGALLGRLQPYSVYIPQATTPPGGWGLTLLLHGSTENYNKNAGTREEQELALRGKGSIVLQPEARGPMPSYNNVVAAADVFEAWADAASHYRLDPGFTDIAGYSEGGIGALLLASRFPDLFAKVQPTVGYASAQQLLPSLRHVPVLMWNASADEAINVEAYGPTAALLQHLGYRYELDVFAPAEHTTLADDDQWQPAADWLDSTTVERNPQHVTYVADPADDSGPTDTGYVADHAYWISAITLRSTTPNAVDTAGGPTATASVDAVSHGLGVGDAPASPPQLGSGLLTGGTLPVPLAYSRTYVTWGAEAPQPALDRLDLTLTNVRSLTVDLRRAHLDCNADLRVSTDGPVSITLAGCGRTVAFG